jgi:hypothetical protein
MCSYADWKIGTQWYRKIREKKRFFGNKNVEDENGKDTGGGEGRGESHTNFYRPAP